jgi:carboxyl-terminal processing protease
MTRFRTLTIALASALAALVAGLWLGGHPDVLPDGLRGAFVEDDRALQAEVLETIEDNYYKPVKEEDLKNASLKGIVRSLNDQFSHYFTPSETERFEESVSGKFEGVGMTVEQVRRGLRVLSVFDRTPAQRAGIRKGDLITQVDGESIAGMATDIATAKIKGKPGTSVRLTVVTPGNDRPRSLAVKRARIDVPLTESKLETVGGVKLGVVRLFSFSSGAHGAVRQDAERLFDRGARGIVLDLRGNGGGLLNEAVLVSSVFVENGLIVSTRGRKSPERKFDAKGDALNTAVPLVVLVDGGSASASEIVAGALRDRRRAELVGTKTFGKGVFQEVESLSNGGALDLTVGSYYLPSGQTIAPRKGLVPQVKARDLPRTKRDEAMPVALETLRKKVG